MKQTALLIALAMTGCASFKTKQADERTLPDGSKTSITTYAASRTFFSSKSSLAHWKAQQTEGEQGATVGDLNQQGATNSVDALRAIADILEKLRP
jgi:hypothetical protein